MRCDYDTIRRAQLGVASPSVFAPANHRRAGGIQPTAPGSTPKNGSLQKSIHTDPERHPLTRLQAAISYTAQMHNYHLAPLGTVTPIPANVPQLAPQWLRCTGRAHLHLCTVHAHR